MLKGAHAGAPTGADAVSKDTRFVDLMTFVNNRLTRS
jgi:hypothetical protein